MTRRSQGSFGCSVPRRRLVGAGHRLLLLLPHPLAAARLPLGGSHGLAAERRAAAFACFHFFDHFRDGGRHE